VIGELKDGKDSHAIGSLRWLLIWTWPGDGKMRIHPSHYMISGICTEDSSAWFLMFIHTRNKENMFLYFIEVLKLET